MFQRKTLLDKCTWTLIQRYRYAHTKVSATIEYLMKKKCISNEDLLAHLAKKVRVRVRVRSTSDWAIPTTRKICLAGCDRLEEEIGEPNIKIYKMSFPAALAAIDWLTFLCQKSQPLRIAWNFHNLYSLTCWIRKSTNFSNQAIFGKVIGLLVFVSRKVAPMTLPMTHVTFSSCRAKNVLSILLLTLNYV